MSALGSRATAAACERLTDARSVRLVKSPNLTNVNVMVSQVAILRFMSTHNRRPRRNTLLRLLLTGLLLAAVAFAPIARAVCDLQHIVAVSADLHSGAGGDGESGSQPDQHDACCDGGLTAMTSEAGLAGDVGAAASSAWFLATPVLHGFALPLRAEPVGDRQAAPPYEPIFRRFPKLLI